MRKTREIIKSGWKKQMFIITELVVKLARFYFDCQGVIIDLHSRQKGDRVKKNHT